MMDQIVQATCLSVYLPPGKSHVFLGGVSLKAGVGIFRCESLQTQAKTASFAKLPNPAFKVETHLPFLQSHVWVLRKAVRFCCSISPELMSVSQSASPPQSRLWPAENTPLPPDRCTHTHTHTHTHKGQICSPKALELCTPTHKAGFQSSPGQRESRSPLWARPPCVPCERRWSSDLGAVSEPRGDETAACERHCLSDTVTEPELWKTHRLYSAVPLVLSVQFLQLCSGTLLQLCLLPLQSLQTVLQLVDLSLWKNTSVSAEQEHLRSSSQNKKAECFTGEWSWTDTSLLDRGFAVGQLSFQLVPHLSLLGQLLQPHPPLELRSSHDVLQRRALKKRRRMCVSISHFY